ncbi:MAG: hypothetical protein ACFBZ9_18515 [Sphingomonadales bacterium]
MSKMADYEAGQLFEISYPFYRDEYDLWTPGHTSRFVHPDDFEAVAHAEGKMILEIMDVHRPGAYPTRVFYTRRFIDPEGNPFGNERYSRALRITTVPHFRRKAEGYAFDYVLVEPRKPDALEDIDFEAEPERTS